MMRRIHEPLELDGDVIWGMELIMDIDGCNVGIITDPASLRQYTAELVDRLKMRAYGDTWLHHFGHASPVTAGYTAFQPIETSSITVHMSDALARAHINIFSCRPFDVEEALDYTEAFFAGSDTTFSVLSR